MNPAPECGRFLDQIELASREPRAALRKALFLDRDGIINFDHGYVHTAGQTEWVPGIFELCTQAAGDGFLLVVVTNQAGIARGYYSEAEFLEYTRWVHEEFAARDVPLSATYYCPHHPSEGFGRYRVRCTCRKPQPGMLLAAMSELGISPDTSRLIGDKPTDIAAGVSAGISCCRLVEHAWLPTRPDFVDH